MINKKYLGIDFGEKKVGISISDDSGKIAFPLMIIDLHKINTLKLKKEENLINLEKEILKIILEKKINFIIFGESLKENGERNKIDLSIKSFAKNLKERLEEENLQEIKIDFEKEWFSSVLARDFLENINFEKKKKKTQKKIDDNAATIILQRYLDKVNKN